MKNFIIKSIAATTLWAACVAAVFLLTACKPGVVNQPEDPKETGPEQPIAQVDDTAQRTTGDTQPGTSDRPWETWTECSQKPGDHPCNFSLIDQHGNAVELYDHYDKVIVIDLSSIWCVVCQNIATKGDELITLYGEDNFIWITVLIDGTSHGVAPTAAEIQAWVDAFHIQAPVLAGDRTLVDLSAETGYPITSWPTIVVIDKTMVLYSGINGWSEATVRAWVESLL